MNYHCERRFGQMISAWVVLLLALGLSGCAVQGVQTRRSPVAIGEACPNCGLAVAQGCRCRYHSGYHPTVWSPFTPQPVGRIEGSIEGSIEVDEEVAIPSPDTPKEIAPEQTAPKEIGTEQIGPGEIDPKESGPKAVSPDPGPTSFDMDFPRWLPESGDESDIAEPSGEQEAIRVVPPEPSLPDLSSARRRQLEEDRTAIPPKTGGQADLSSPPLHRSFESSRP